jgi:hypothetical protein
MNSSSASLSDAEALRPIALGENTPRSFLSLLLGLYYAPKRSFLALKARPYILYPILGLVLLGVISNLALVKKVGRQGFYAKIFDASVAAGTMSVQEAQKRTQELVENDSELSLTARLALQSVIMALLFPLAVAAVFRLLTFLLDGDNNFREVYSVTLCAYLATGIVATLLMLPVIFFKKPEEVNFASITITDLSSLLKIAAQVRLPSLLDSLLSWIEVFAIWTLVLLSIGYAAISRRLPAGKIFCGLAVLYTIAATLNGLFSILLS